MYAMMARAMTVSIALRISANIIVRIPFLTGGSSLPDKNRIHDPPDRNSAHTQPRTPNTESSQRRIARTTASHGSTGDASHGYALCIAPSSLPYPSMPLTALYSLARFFTRSANCLSTRRRRTTTFSVDGSSAPAKVLSARYSDRATVSSKYI